MEELLVYSGSEYHNSEEGIDTPNTKWLISNILPHSPYKVDQPEPIINFLEKINGCLYNNKNKKAKKLIISENSGSVRHYSQ